MGRARELKSHVNMIFKTHGLKAGLVQEIKQRGAAVRAKAQVNEEIKQRMRLIRAKERINTEIKEGFEDFRGNFKRKQQRSLQHGYIEMKPITKAQRFRNLPVARQMYMK